ncbi:hypothetical protein [Paraconexibacter algicola]|uniref:Uncharacterized protein n=1 Tax=Paraconexibacter algicola TaxID=2133960 RepID=A0A2T4UEZ7_9ACTN|nr:hypothetical protein [Paraconexibacter algicola]PTL56350.1 hypothetical protein C7Y72_15395 [Paraconexibacter algicola]
MKRSTKVTVAAVALALAVPAAALGTLDEVGVLQGTPAPAPSCPDRPCQAIPKTTGYQAKVDTNRSVHVIPKDGRIVAWTITLGKPGKEQTKFFNEGLGGEPQAQITILRPGNKLYYRAVAQGEPQKLSKYFGQTVQFPLERSIPVKKGWVVGLTVPTWAPALAVNQPGTTSWRASRGKGKCNDFDRQTAQTKEMGISQFYCLYRTARLTYSATLVSTP